MAATGCDHFRGRRRHGRRRRMKLRLAFSR